MGTRSFPEVELTGRAVYYPPPSSAEVKERIELYIYSLLWAFVAFSRVNFTFTLPLHNALYDNRKQILR
jgi:hypothetical protein